MKHMSNSLLLIFFTTIAIPNTQAHGGNSVLGGFAGGMAGGMVGGLVSGAMTKSSSSSSSSEVVSSGKGYYRDIDKLESAVRFDLLKLDDKINNVSRDVSTLKEKVGADKDIQDLSAVKKDIKSVKTLVQNNESKVDTLEEKVDALEKKVSKLESTITRDKKALEDRIEKLETLIESKKLETKSKELSVIPGSNDLESNDHKETSSTSGTKPTEINKVSPKFQINETSPESTPKSL